MRQLPLQSQHEAKGARFQQYGEWRLPEAYAIPLAEYQAVRERVALMDLSHDGHYLLSGGDRTDFLQNLMSNDIHRAGPETGIFSTLLTAKGKVAAAFDLYPLPEAFLLEIESKIAEKTVQHLMRFKFRSKIKIEPALWGKLVVAGPQARLFLSERMRIPLPASTEERSFLYSKTDPVLVVRKTETGEEDYHLYCREENLGAFFAELVSAGEGGGWGMALVGQAALAILRVEAGIPRYGLELDEDRIPIEAGLEESAISYTKGCYPGQEVVARIKTYGHVNRHLMGLRLDGEGVPGYRDPVFMGNYEIGWVTSGINSPFCQAPIAMAYLRTEAALPGTPVEVAIRQTRAGAVVVKLPFYKK